ncbi:MAG: hypothetical protein ACH346_03800 [Chthoniobacterales bacterium]
MVLTLDAKRRLTLPKELFPTQPGDYFDASFDAHDEIIIFRKLPAKADWLKVLKSCPVSMDDVPRRSREMPKKSSCQEHVQH